MSRTVYDREFYQRQVNESVRSAEVVVPLVNSLIHAASVTDVGCGLGSWASVFARHGVTDVWGVDGDYVDREMLLIPKDRFVATNLSRPFRMDRKFDLVVSLEVAEHLPPGCAETFVDTLTGLGQIVLFSAAIPWQSGTDHLNERYQDFWQALFEARGFVAIDYVRKQIWGNMTLPVWYVQNIILYAHREVIDEHIAIRRAWEESRHCLIPIVHPRVFECFADPDRLDLRRVGLRRVLRALPGLFYNSFMGRMRR